MSNSETKNTAVPYLFITVVSLILIFVFETALPQYCPISFFDFLTPKGSLWVALKHSWFFFVWSIFLNLIFALSNEYDADDYEDAGDTFISNCMQSIRAGVVEEICFRWIILSAAIACMGFCNYVFFGFAGVNIVQWICMHVVGPVANICTLGYFHDYFRNEHMWAIGAAILISNQLFNKSHADCEIHVQCNILFGGFWMTYVLFTYGLGAAILVHFMYDFCSDVVFYIVARTVASRFA